MSVEPLRQRLSYGLYGRCATLVAGREAPDQLVKLLAEKQKVRVTRDTHVHVYA